MFQISRRNALMLCSVSLLLAWSLPTWGQTTQPTKNAHKTSANTVVHYHYHYHVRAHHSGKGHKRLHAQKHPGAKVVVHYHYHFGKRASRHGKHDPHAMRHPAITHDFSDVKRWVKVFENPKRKLWQKPAEVAKVMDIKPGMAVAEIGAGTGYFLPYLRSALGASGKLLALDIAGTLVKYMNERMIKAGWKNALARKVKPNDPQLASGSLDRILIANTWHHIEDRVNYGKKLLSGLKPGGALYIVDFAMYSPFGPGKRYRLSEAQVMKELKQAGFQVKLAKETLAHHYIVVGIKK